MSEDTLETVEVTGTETPSEGESVVETPVTEETKTD